MIDSIIVPLGTHHDGYQPRSPALRSLVAQPAA
jgi:hypothetical protein